MQDFPSFSPAFQAALDRLAIAVRVAARGRGAGEVRSRVRGRAIEFADYRPYTPGDDPKLVDWRAYTRLDRLYLKQSEEERARTLTLLVDTSASLDWGEGEAHKGRYARRLAAALAWLSLGRLEPVRIHLLRDGSASPLPPVAIRPGAVALFRQLGAIREAGRTRLAPAVRTALSGAPPGPIVLLSDLLDPAWPEALDALAGTGEGILLQVLAPDEWAPDFALLGGDEVELEDAETGELRPARLGPAELGAYRERLEAFLAAVRRESARRGVAYAALDTSTPLQETVLTQLPAAGILQ